MLQFVSAGGSGFTKLFSSFCYLQCSTGSSLPSSFLLEQLSNHRTFHQDNVPQELFKAAARPFSRGLLRCGGCQKVFYQVSTFSPFFQLCVPAKMIPTMKMMDRPPQSPDPNPMNKMKWTDLLQIPRWALWLELQLSICDLNPPKTLHLKSRYELSFNRKETKTLLFCV